MTPPIALTIAAHDPLGGAGLAADITTFAAFGVHGVLAITALSAQHLASVDRVLPVDDDFVSRQIDGILDEVQPHAVKVGLLGSAIVASDLARRVSAGQLVAPVVDPVMVDGRGVRFVSADIEDAYRSRLFPVSRVITPNINEAEIFLGERFSNADDVVGAAAALAGLGAELVVVTGGGLVDGDAVDVAVESNGSVELLRSPRSSTLNTRGTGCTFAAAITAALARGLEPMDAARSAKRFVSSRIADSSEWVFATGKVGPVSHLFRFGD